MKTLTAERLRELVDYDPETGVFAAKINRCRARAGQILGSPIHHGYLCIGIDYGRYLAHRLAWLWMTGSWPSKSIDHMNGNTSDNRWSNLREADHSTNMHNIKGPKKHNRSGFLGVARYGNRWRARIAKNKVIRNLGWFSTPEEAYAAYSAEKQRELPDRHSNPR